MSDVETAWQTWTKDRSWFHADLPKVAKEGFTAGYRQALLDAADAIQALHPGEVKASVTFLRHRALHTATAEGSDHD